MCVQVRHREKTNGQRVAGYRLIVGQTPVQKTLCFEQRKPNACSCESGMTPAVVKDCEVE